MSWEKLKANWPWPPERPQVPLRMNDGWFDKTRTKLLSRYTGQHVRGVVELGSWMGLSTRWFHAMCPHAQIVAIDHWQGCVEHHRDPKYAGVLPTLASTFLANCWLQRDRIIPLRIDTQRGMELVAAEGVPVDLVYVDASHDTESVHDDIVTAWHCFPDAVLTGDDWHDARVRAGVEGAAGTLLRLNRNVWNIESEGRAWRLYREDREHRKAAG